MQEVNSRSVTLDWVTLKLVSYTKALLHARLSIKIILIFYRKLASIEDSFYGLCFNIHQKLTVSSLLFFKKFPHELVDFIWSILLHPVTAASNVSKRVRENAL